MSLDKLPTELDIRVLDFLDQGDLSAMSMVSKTYRGVVEPLLYRHLELRKYQSDQVCWLAVTILFRPKLAAHIRAINLTDINHVSSGDSDSAQVTPISTEYLVKGLDILKDIILDALGSDMNLGKVYLPWVREKCAKNHFEKSLVMIVAWAVNIESITHIETIARACMTDCWDLLPIVMWHLYRYSPDQTLQTHYSTVPARDLSRFSKLRHVHLETRSWNAFVAFPSLEVLRIRGSSRLSISETSLLISPCMMNLHTLELVEPSCSTDDICEIFGNGEAPNLMNMVLHLNAWLEYNCFVQTVIDTLREHCPQLKEFEIRHLNLERDMLEPLENLTDLTNLSILRTELNLLVDSNDRSGLLSLDKLLPPKLKELHICSVDAEDLLELAGPYIRSASYVASDFEYLYQLAYMVSIQKLSVTIDFDYDQPRELLVEYRLVKEFLAFIAANVHARTGISIRIYRSALGDEEEPKLLIENSVVFADIDDRQ